jgi:hypothetical protein
MPGIFSTLEMVENVGVGDGEIDTLQIDQVRDVADGTVRHDRQDAQVVGVIERLAEVGGILREGAFEQSAGHADRPVVDARGPGNFILADRLVGDGQGALWRLAELRQNLEL